MIVIVGYVNDDGYFVETGRFSDVSSVPGELRNTVFDLIDRGGGVKQVGEYIIMVKGVDKFDRILKEWSWT